MVPWAGRPEVLGPTVMVMAAGAVALTSFSATTSKVKVSAKVGVPVIALVVGSSVRPEGSVPLVTAKVGACSPAGVEAGTE